MKRAILVLAGLSCCGQLGCDHQSTAKLILTVGLNSRTTWQPKGVVTTAAQRQPPPVDALVAALRDLRQFSRGASATDQPSQVALAGNIDRIVELATQLENELPENSAIARQARDARCIALARAAAILPAEYTDRLDAYSNKAFGQTWDRGTVEKQAINRIVSDYLVSARLPADAPQVMALHTVTFPRHAMNVELYTTIADRLVGEGELRTGLDLARAGLVNCASHSDVGRLTRRVKQFYREHPGEVGVPMDFTGPTMGDPRFTLSSLQGRPVLVVFWSTRHPASDVFMVRCNTLAEQFAATEIAIVGVSLNADMEDLEAWYATHGFHCPNVFSAEPAHAGFENPIARYYRVTAVPQFFLLDREGIVVERGANDLGLIQDALRQLATPQLARVR